MFRLASACCAPAELVALSIRLIIAGIFLLPQNVTSLSPWTIRSPSR
jgi:hypothetical protein